MKNININITITLPKLLKKNLIIKCALKIGKGINPKIISQGTYTIAAAIKETKFENLSDVIANNKLFSVIYFDNMKQLKDFINFVDSMNIPNGRNESRVFAHMYIE